MAKENSSKRRKVISKILDLFFYLGLIGLIYWLATLQEKNALIVILMYVSVIVFVVGIVIQIVMMINNKKIIKNVVILFNHMKVIHSVRYGLYFQGNQYQEEIDELTNQIQYVGNIILQTKESFLNEMIPYNFSKKQIKLLKNVYKETEELLSSAQPKWDFN